MNDYTQAIDAVRKLRAVGATMVELSGERVRVEFDAPFVPVAAAPPLPEDPTLRAAELKRRADDLDFHSA